MKKLISTLLCVSVLLSAASMAIYNTMTTVAAVTDSDFEIIFGKTLHDSISENNEQSSYRLALDNSGRISVDFYSDDLYTADLTIYDEKGQKVWGDHPYVGSGAKHIAYSTDIELLSGDYEFTVSSFYYGSYDLKISFESANESFVETQGDLNNTLKTASEIKTDRSYAGQIAENDNVDYYAFTLDSSGELDLDFSAENMRQARLAIYDEKGQEVWSEKPRWNETSKQISFIENTQLVSGTYYFEVSKDYDNYYATHGTYEFELSFVDADESFAESQSANDNTLKSANEIETNREYIGQIAYNDEIDTYAFTLYDSDGFELNFSAENVRAFSLTIYDKKGQEVWRDTPYWNNDTSKQISYSKDVVLDSGEYYFTVSKNYNYYGAYTFSLDIDSGSQSSDENYNRYYYDDDDDNYRNDSDDDDDYNNDPEETSFGSAVSDWAKDEVEEAYKSRLIPETIIRKNLTEYIDRAEFAAIAVQLYESVTEEEARASSAPFRDISGNRNENSIKKAYALGFTDGTSASTFEPNANIDREQLATMLARTVKKLMHPEWTLADDYKYTTDLDDVKLFDDDAEISDWAWASVYLMAKLGVVKGIDNTHFAPRNLTSRQEAEGYATATREQAILMSLRIYNDLAER